MSDTPRDPTRPRKPAYRFAALLWALLHTPLTLALYWTGMWSAIRATPPGFRLALAPTFLPQVLLIATVAWLLALPFSPWPRVYRFAAPALAGLFMVAVALDASVYRVVGYHLNGFFLRVALQPTALREAGVLPADVAVHLAGAAAFLALETASGAWFLRRFASGRRAYGWALGMLLLAAAERVYGGTLACFGGPAVFAASTVFPLQVPVRMDPVVQKVVGKRPMVDLFAGGNDALRLAPGIPPQEITFARRPDVVVLLAESLPADHLDAKTMPNLWRRSAEGGARFTHHYAAASSTNYSLFSLFYGLQAQKLEATVGSGRRPVLFPALKRNGYQIRVDAASCVDWLGLRETVFGEVDPGELRTWCSGGRGDREMFEDARAFVEGADERPIFLFLFSFGTHFDYFCPPEMPPVFQPAWQGAGAIEASRVPGWLIENRARNAAHALDASQEAFLTAFEKKRGRRPIVFFTGDHGEEFGQKGRLGHGSNVTDAQIHVPFLVMGDGVPRGTFDRVSGHVDLVPTLLGLLGDKHPPALYADGMSVFDAPEDRFVTSTVGWEPYYAVIGRDLKATMYAGLARVEITDPEDQPLSDGSTRLAASAARMMRALRGDSASGAAQPSAARTP